MTGVFTSVGALNLALDLVQEFEGSAKKTVQVSEERQKVDELKKRQVKKDENELKKVSSILFTIKINTLLK